MAISPPSDIVLDVARAVDPISVQAARAELVRRAAAAGPSERFTVAEPAQQPQAGAPLRGAKEPDTLQRFEAMVLRTFVQNIMPEETEAVYGGGMAGDMWKSMMAEKLADAMAARGGIGIADRLLRDHYVVDEAKIPVGPVSDIDARADTDRQLMLSAAMVQEMQRRLARAMAEDSPPASAASAI